MNREWVNNIMSFFAKGQWVRKNLSQWITMILVIVDTGLGVAIILGGLDRFPPPSYIPLVEYTQGNIWIWGALILLAACLTVCGRRIASIIGLWISMFWYIVWMTAFIIAAFNYPTAALTPIVAYCGFALISATLLTARVIEPKGA